MNIWTTEQWEPARSGLLNRWFEFRKLISNQRSDRFLSRLYKLVKEPSSSWRSGWRRRCWTRQQPEPARARPVNCDWFAPATLWCDWLVLVLSTPAQHWAAKHFNMTRYPALLVWHKDELAVSTAHKLHNFDDNFQPTSLKTRHSCPASKNIIPSLKVGINNECTTPQFMPNTNHRTQRTDLDI